MNILVVGGAGYIGSHMCKCLSEAGHRVTVLDNLATGHRQAVQWGELVVGPLDDRALVADILKSRGIDAVMHFAASSLVGESVVDPFRYYQNNVSATLALLQVMREQAELEDDQRALEAARDAALATLRGGEKSP